MSQQNIQKIGFRAFLASNFPDYIIDKANARIIDDLSLWAARDEKFNGRPSHDGGGKSNWHIDRGVTIIGPVGVGKDELFRMLRKYLSYLHSPYGYFSKVVWKFANEFSKDKVGFNAFKDEFTGNGYYEELCLTDEKTGLPEKEKAQSYGTKVLVGDEIIRIRYDLWKAEGWQTHFSTNENEDKLEEVYGHRGYSRLKEMTNIMSMNGENRRYTIAPKFTKKNNNNPQPPASREITVDEIKWNKDKLNNDYKNFLATGQLPVMVAVDFNLLQINGVQVATEDELLFLMEAAAPTFVPDPKMVKKTESEKEKARKEYAWEQARKTAVQTFYMRMKEVGAKSIFDPVDYLFKAPGNKVGSTSVAELVKPVGEKKHDFIQVFSIKDARATKGGDSVIIILHKDFHNSKGISFCEVGDRIFDYNDSQWMRVTHVDTEDPFKNKVTLTPELMNQEIQIYALAVLGLVKRLHKDHTGGISIVFGGTKQE